MEQKSLQKLKQADFELSNQEHILREQKIKVDTPEIVWRKLDMKEDTLKFQHENYYNVCNYIIDRRCVKLTVQCLLSLSCVVISSIRILQGDISPVFISLLSSQVGLWLPSPSL